MAAFPAHRREQAPASQTTASSVGGTAVTTVAPALLRPSPATQSPAQSPAATARPPRLRVTVARFAADGTRVERSALDSDAVPPPDAHRLHALVDGVEAAGPPAGSSFGLVQRQGGATPRYEVSAARGFGNWTVTVPVGLHGTALAALIDHVCGVPDGS